VSINYDRSIDFGAFHTYSWARPVSAAEGAQSAARREPQSGSLIAKQIVAAVDAELRKKGLRPVPTAGDLEVAFHVALSRGYDVTSYGYPPRLRSAHGTAQVRAVDAGSLIVDLVDPRTKELAWRAIASDDLDADASAAGRDARIAAVAEKMFADFPPRP
jgi:hypothetical protein